MRTRFRKPVSHATLLNHFEWASARNHGREMRKARQENETLKLALRLKQAMALVLFSPLLAFGQVNGVVVTVPEGTHVVVVRELTNKVAKHLVAPMPPTPAPPTPMSIQMRNAAQLAKGKAAPWTQRFMAVHVIEDAQTRTDKNGVSKFSTNYFVTYAAPTWKTNELTAWGTFTLETTRPTKRGDVFEFFPVHD